jgi:glycosyltransferase involved in cell wall biosynthesis
MKRPLRFVLVTTFYPPFSFGGDAIHVESLAGALVRAGHRVDVIHCVDAYRTLQLGGLGGRKPPDVPGLTVHGLSSGGGPLSPLLSQQTGFPLLKTRRIREILDRADPDVIHFHNVSLFGPGILRLRGKGGRTLKLYTTHEYWLVCPTHVLWKYNRRVCDGRDCIRCTLRAGRPPQLWRYTHMIERCAADVDAFLSPSRYAAVMHEQHGFRRAIEHFPLFVERPTAIDRDLPRPHPRPYFLFVGRLEAVKNPRSLIEAWRRVPVGDLLIAGTGSQLEELRALAGGDPRIRFLGHVGQESLAGLYAHCIACVVPSAMVEIFPLVVLEAFSHKAPVVARNLGALAEMITESDGGLLYRTEDDLIAALGRIAQDPRLRSELAENGHRLVAGRWSEAAYLRRYFDLLSELAVRKFGEVPWDEDEDAGKRAGSGGS